MLEVEQYISQFKPEVQEKLQALRGTIRNIIPNAKERISYGIPTFTLDRNVVHYAAFKKHIGFYALPATTQTLGDELAKYKTGKGSIQFPIDEELPLDLIGKLVRARLQELQST